MQEEVGQFMGVQSIEVLGSSPEVLNGTLVPTGLYLKYISGSKL
jgi:hypothetical protein